MLSTPIDQDTLVALVKSDEWIVSQKIDGRRALIEVDNGDVKVYGRGGKEAAIGRTMEVSFKSALPNGRWLIDGEIAKNEQQQWYFFAFDLPEAGELITTDTPFAKRLTALEHVARISNWDNHPLLGVLHYARTREDKVRLITRLKANHAEGVIFRHLDSIYEEGIRSARSLKFKFVLEADCWVSDIGVGGKSNVELSVLRDGEPFVVGKCTALAGEGASIQLNDVVTVRYLYASEDGKLVQPTYPLIRTDKLPSECDFLQLIPANREIVNLL